MERSAAVPVDAGELEGPPAVGETDLVFVKKGGEVEDVTIPFEMNGRRFMMLTIGEQPLKMKQDFRFNRQTGVITLNASLLERLTASGEFGEQARLTTYFNLGAPWTFRVIYYDTPVFGAAEGTTEDFAIPSNITAICWQRWKLTMKTEASRVAELDAVQGILLHLRTEL